MKIMQFKKLAAVLILICGTTVASQAQTDSIKALYKAYVLLFKKNELLADSISKLNNSVSSVNLKVNSLSTDLSSSVTKINKLTSDDLFSKEVRLKNKRDKVLSTAVYIKSANNSFDAIDAALAVSDYLSDVNNLNNPSNEELGFSLVSEVTDILKLNIIKGSSKFNNKAPEKFISVVQEVIKNPITTAVVSYVPALNAINNVFNLVSSLCTSEKGVEVGDLINFKKSLDRYMTHYEKLGKASYDFSSNIDKLKVRIDALRTVMVNFTVERINTVYPNAVKPDSNMNLNDLISTYYTTQKLEIKIDSVIDLNRRGGSVNYQNVINDNVLAYPFYVTNQAQFVQQELESVASEYVSAYKLYHRRISDVLISSKSISKKPEVIDVKLNELGDKLTRLVKTFERNVKIREVNENLQRIPTL